MKSEMVSAGDGTSIEVEWLGDSPWFDEEEAAAADFSWPHFCRLRIRDGKAPDGNEMPAIFAENWDVEHYLADDEMFAGREYPGIAITAPTGTLITLPRRSYVRMAAKGHRMLPTGEVRNEYGAVCDEQRTAEVLKQYLAILRAESDADIDREVSQKHAEDPHRPSGFWDAWLVDNIFDKH